MNKWLTENDCELNEMYEDYIESICSDDLERGDYDSFEEFAGMAYIEAQEGQVTARELKTDAGKAKLSEIIKDEAMGCKIAKAIHSKMLKKGIKKETLELYFA